MNSNSFETNIARPSSLPKHCVFIFSSIKYEKSRTEPKCVTTAIITRAQLRCDTEKNWHEHLRVVSVQHNHKQYTNLPYSRFCYICMWVIKCWYPVWPNSMLQTKRHNGISNLKLICAVKNIGALSQRQVILVPAIKFPKCKQRRRAANPCYNCNSHVRDSLTL